MVKSTKTAVPGFDGERKTPLESIRACCVQCQGGSYALVSECTSPLCPFYQYRAGEIAAGASRRLLRVIKSYCDACAPDGDVAGCTAGRGYLSLSPCPLWPFRSGRSPYYSEKTREARRARALSLFGARDAEAGQGKGLGGL